MGLLSALLMAGIIQDGWAHNHGKVDQSFITPWHFILYGTMALNGIVLLICGLANLKPRLADRQSFWPAVRASIPYGYWSSAIGVILFIVAGGLDFAWHTLFGVEVSLSALVSPTHLALALAAALVFSGPIRSVAHRYGPESGGWRRVGPVVPALAATMTLVGFFTQYAQPIGDDGIAAVVAKSNDAPVVNGLYAMQADGRGQRRLFPSTHEDLFGPSISPDGKLVVYRAAADGADASDLFVGRIDGGTNPRRITHSGRHDTQPAWSPDGAWIAFVSAPAGTSGEYQLDVVRSDGTALRTLTHGIAAITGPSWSPDGSRIAVCSRNGIADEIEIVTVKGGAATWLASAQGSWPAWSRDGSNIYFSQTDEEGNRMSISVARADGSSQSSTVVAGASMPAVSPDGKSIAYVQADRGTDQVFVASLDGTKATDVSQLSGLDASRPAWTPDGRIVFVTSGRQRPQQSDYALSLSLSGVLIQSIIVAGSVLLLVRRWRAPLGSVTAMLVFFAAAMATQNDDYFGILAALGAGLAGDAIVAAYGERSRAGLPFYVLGFALPLVLSVLYVVFLGFQRGIGWPPNLVLGSPFIAGFAGLLVAFAYDPPLGARPGPAPAK